MNGLQLAQVMLLAVLGCAALVITQRFHGRWTADLADGGRRKAHEGSPSRVAALPIGAAMLLGMWWMARTSTSAAAEALNLLLGLMLASVPVVLLGLADDLTQRVTPRWRMLAAAASAVLAMVLMGQVIPRVGVPGVDLLVAWAPVGVLVTVLMVCGFTNAMNIIDGLNGLSAGLGVLMCAATGWLAHSVGDPALVALCGVLGAALLGFWLVNFPRGWLFMGDGAAYFVGFMLSQIWILLVIRHESISPWIVLAIGFQPTMETVFSILRRRFIHRAKGQAMQADRLHLHCLVFRRRTMHWGLLSGKPRWMANAAAAVWVLGFGALPMLLAVLGPSTTAWGALVLAAGVTGYLVWFRRLVLFKGVGPFGARTRPARAQAAALTVTSVLDR